MSVAAWISVRDLLTTTDVTEENGREEAQYSDHQDNNSQNRDHEPLRVPCCRPLGNPELAEEHDDVPGDSRRAFLCSDQAGK